MAKVYNQLNISKRQSYVIWSGLIQSAKRRSEQTERLTDEEILIEDNGYPD